MVVKAKLFFEFYEMKKMSIAELCEVFYKIK